MFASWRGSTAWRALLTFLKDIVVIVVIDEQIFES